MMTIQFTVPGEPQGKARPRILRSGKAYTPKRTADYERAIRDAFLDAGGKLTEHPVKVSVTAYYQIPKSVSNRMKERMLVNEILPMKRPDIDNVGKCVLDALNKVAYKDDAQVCAMHVEKYYNDDPMIVVTVRELIL